MKAKQLLFILLLLFIKTNTAQSGFGAQQIISLNTGRATDVSAVDLDQDGDIDALATFQNHKLAWYENDGMQNFTEHIISTNADRPTEVISLDMDQDGDVDIVTIGAVYFKKLAWYENDGMQNFTRHIINNNPIYGGHDVFSIDLDSDGDFDLITTNRQSTSIDSLLWYENDGLQNFTRHTIGNDYSENADVHAGDIDSDGDIDIFSASDDYLNGSYYWFENDGMQNFTKHAVPSTIRRGQTVFIIDVDQDGYTDLVIGGLNSLKIAWYKNDGMQNFTEIIIDHYSLGPREIKVLDLDNDTDLDILVAELGDNIVWHENDGSQNFTEHTITTLADFAWSNFAIDVDGDCDIDVLSASTLDLKVAWYPNLLYTINDSIIDTAICVGESIMVNGINYNTTGTYHDSIIHQGLGCGDSVRYTINLLVANPYDSIINATICANDSFVLLNKSYLNSGSFLDTLQHQNFNCDSIFYTLNLSVLPVDTLQINAIICAGDSLLVNHKTYKNTGSFLDTLAYQNTSCDSILFELNILVQPIFYKNVTKQICFGDSISVNNKSYHTSGQYFDTIFYQNTLCDSLLFNIQLQVNPLPNIVIYSNAKGDSICENNQLTLNANTDQNNVISWSDGIINKQAFEIDLGFKTYYVAVTDTFLCVNFDSIEIHVFDAVQQFSPMADQEYCSEDQNILNVNYPASNFIWNTGETSNYFNVTESGTFWVHFQENTTGCFFSDTINVLVKNCINDCVVALPSAFSPDQNGLNDFFKILTDCQKGFSFFSLKIYNRWGENVFSSSEPNKTWDGSFKGTKMTTGIYSYTLEYIKNTQTEKVLLSGTVSLL